MNYMSRIFRPFNTVKWCRDLDGLVCKYNPLWYCMPSVDRLYLVGGVQCPCHLYAALSETYNPEDEDDRCDLYRGKKMFCNLLTQLYYNMPVGIRQFFVSVD